MTRAYTRFGKRSRVFNLDAISIDEASEWLVENLEEAGADKSDRLRMRLLFEEALINMASHHGAEQEVKATLDKWRGRYRLRVTAVGDRFNPLKREMQGAEEWPPSLFSIIDMNVHYAYSLGANVLRLYVSRPPLNPVLKIIIAILAGLLIGLLGNALAPANIHQIISEVVLHPIADMCERVLQAISGPVIFLTALTATFGTKRIADLGGSRFTTIARYFVISTLVVVFSLLCCQLFFPLDVAETKPNGQVLSELLDGILQIVPGNVVEPFVNANTLQLLLIAIVTGSLLAAIEPQVKELKTMIQQLSVLGFAVAQRACRLVPFFVALLLCLKIWTHDTALLGGILLPLAISVALSVIVFIVILLVTSIRFRVSPILFAKKLEGPFADALKRGTLDFSIIDDLARSCAQLLGLDGEFARAALPQGLFLYMPTSAIGICVFSLYAAEVQQLNVDQAWLVAVAALSVTLSVATPPITGANLLSFVMAFAYLGISTDAFLDVMVFDIVFGVICIAFDQAMLQIETVNQAKRMGFLDEDALRAPIS